MTLSHKAFLALIALAAIIMAAKRQDEKLIGVRENLSLFRTESTAFAASTTQLKNAIWSLEKGSPESISAAIKALKNARMSYKRIESFMEYFFVNSARIYNRAAKNEIEEPYLEYQKPMGLQHMEALLFEDDPVSHQKELLGEINILENSARDINSMLYQFNPTDNQILESHRLELIRIITLGITGFDAPLLKSGIDESYEALQNMQKGLAPYLHQGKNNADSVSRYLNSSLLFLKQNPEFDSFDRLLFLTGHALPLQKHLGKMISDMSLTLNTNGILNYRAENLFSADAFNGEVFGEKSTRDVIALGKKLFSDPILSGNSKISCSSCHLPETYFQDGIEKSLGFDGKRKVARNTPTLLYASFQHSQFWDGRVKTLEEQIENVIRDSLEMNGKPAIIVSNIRKQKKYRKLLKKVYSEKKGAFTEKAMYDAIASFVRTLHPFKSNFDRYLQGDKQAMTASQMNGFNLFMGKGQCGTCHFAPLFNGLIPPLYKFTEFEVLGTTLTENLASPQPDSDAGRFHFRPIEFYNGAFKTPTVRNSAKTAPYMHHGAFNSLDSLMEFYNKGGGAGLGLDLPYQTLSAKSLNLFVSEKKEIIDFLHALTDRTEAKKRKKK
jgi:cytochrome c peroxidase